MPQLQHQPNQRLTSEEIEVRVWATVVIVVTLILAGIVMFMLYSLAFVVQPIKSMAPIDQAFTKMMNDIVLLVVGGIGGVMSRKGVQAVSDKLSSSPDGIKAGVSLEVNKTSVAPATASSGMPDFNWMGFKNPELDESWRPPPPPTTPPDFVHPEKEEIAHERALAKQEAS